MRRFVTTLIATLFLSSWGFSQSIESYFKEAAENNPGLQAIYYEYQAALQKVPQMGALPDPTFSFGYFISPVETRVGPQQARVSLSQMFPWFGTLKAQSDAAALMADAKFQSFIDARNKLYYQVAASLYPLDELNELIKIEQQNINILESYKTIVIKNFENGYGTMIDLLRVEMTLKSAHTNLSILEDKEKPMLTAFNILLNRQESENVIITDSIKIELPPLNLYKDSLISANPLIKAIDLRIKAGEAGELAAQKQGMPKIGLGIDYVIVGERSDITMADNGKDVLMPMVTMTIPVYRSKYKASVKEIQLMQESYSLQKEELANTLFSNYEMVWYEIQKQQQLLSLYEQQIEISQQSLNLLLSAYENSGKEFEDVLKMQQQLLTYQKMKASAISQYNIAYAKLNYLMSKIY